MSDSLNDNKDTELNIYELPIGQLRRAATQIYQIQLTRSMTRDDILDACEKAKARKNYATVVDTHKAAQVNNGPAPGRARITLMASTQQGSTNRPQPVKVNGAIIWVPRGVMCDIPIKHYEVLKNALASKMVEDTTRHELDHERFSMMPQHALPFILHAITEGPDPLPGDEKTRGAKAKPYEMFREQKGYWPTREELNQALDRGEIEGLEGRRLKNQRR